MKGIHPSRHVALKPWGIKERKKPKREGPSRVLRVVLRKCVVSFRSASQESYIGGELSCSVCIVWGIWAVELFEDRAVLVMTVVPK